jgi:2-hydroxychromene-2-carboxylate isomerase
MPMQATWYFDFISPFAWLQWPKLQRLAGRVDWVYRPLLFAGLLQRNDSKGPAEIPGKREFTYRHVLFQAAREGRPMRFPPAHPFNPIPALRLCIAAGGTPEAIDRIFRHVWEEGRAADIDSLRSTARALGIDDLDAALARDDVKAALRANFEAAIADGVFGVPSIVAHGEMFWGNDATPMFEAWLANPALFDTPEMRALKALPEGAKRV